MPNFSTIFLPLLTVFQKFIAKVGELSDTDAQTILSYLLSTDNCRYVAGLPLIPSIAGPRITLFLKTGLRKSHTLFDETEELLFSAYDGGAIPLRQLTQAIRAVLVNQGPKNLNLSKLDGARVTTYLNASSYTSPSQNAPTRDQIGWLDQFWAWVQGWPSGSTFCDHYYLVPTTRGFKCPIDIVFDPQGNDTITDLLMLLGVPVIDPRLSKGASKALKHLYPSSDIPTFLRALPSTVDVHFTEDQANQFCDYLLRHLPSTSYRHGAFAKDKYLRSRL